MLAIVEIFIAEVLLVVTFKRIIFVYWWFLCRICRYSASKKDKLISFKLQISITLYMLNAKVAFSFNPYSTIKIFSVLYLTLSLLFILLVDFTYYKISRIFCIYFDYLKRYNKKNEKMHILYKPIFTGYRWHTIKQDVCFQVSDNVMVDSFLAKEYNLGTNITDYLWAAFHIYFISIFFRKIFIKNGKHVVDKGIKISLFISYLIKWKKWKLLE